VFESVYECLRVFASAESAGVFTSVYECLRVFTSVYECSRVLRFISYFCQIFTYFYVLSDEILLFDCLNLTKLLVDINMTFVLAKLNQSDLNFAWFEITVHYLIFLA
jgi:hypothetical protein